MQILFSSSRRATQRCASVTPSRHRVRFDFLSGGAAFRLLPLFALIGTLALLLGAAPAARAQYAVWSQTYDYHSDNEYTPAKIARDSAGNIIVANTSAFNSASGNYDWTVSKYTPTGTKLWTGTFDSPDTGTAVGSGDDQFVALAVDTSNNIYATGSSAQGSSKLKDWVTVKFSGATGGRLWVKAFGNPYDDFPAAIALDSAQNVYVAGATQFSPTGLNNDIRVVKYDPSGNVLYTSYFNSPDAGTGASPGADTATGLVVNAAGEATVVGRTYQGSARSNDAVVIRFGANGSQVWNKVFNGGSSGTDRFNAVATDSAGNIYAAGSIYFGGTTIHTDALLIKYAPDGTQVWIKGVDGTNYPGITASGYDSASHVIVDSANNIYLAGAVQADAERYAPFLAKFMPSGGVSWLRKAESAYNVTVAALTRDNLNNVYLGYSRNATSSTDRDWVITKYTSAASYIFAYVYNRASANDTLGDIVVDNTVTTRDFYTVAIGEAASGATPADLIVQRHTQPVPPPAIAALDMSVGVDNKPRILWNRLTAPGITLWTVTPTGTPDNGKAYSLPAGWAPICQTIGSDNKLRFLLRENSTQKVAIWTFSANVLTLETGVLFGPVAGYNAKELTISPDGRMRLIWEQNTTKRVALWTLAPTGTSIQSGVYLNPPASGFSFRRISVGNDGIARLLWWEEGSRAYLMTLNAANTAVANNTVYTLSGHYAVDISVGSENKARVLWSNETGSVKIARYTVAGSAADGAPITLGPYPGLRPLSLWMGKGDNKARVMWGYDDGRMVLMRLSAAGAIEQQNTYGPYH